MDFKREEFELSQFDTFSFQNQIKSAAGLSANFLMLFEHKKEKVSFRTSFHLFVTLYLV